jgi:hypothetical protein
LEIFARYVRLKTPCAVALLGEFIDEEYSTNLREVDNNDVSWPTDQVDGCGCAEARPPVTDEGLIQELTSFVLAVSTFSYRACGIASAVPLNVGRLEEPRYPEFEISFATML